jgi:hypothetical protein
VDVHPPSQIVEILRAGYIGPIGTGVCVFGIDPIQFVGPGTVVIVVVVVDINVMVKLEPAGTVSSDLLPRLILPDRHRWQGYKQAELLHLGHLLLTSRSHSLGCLHY